MTEAGGRQRKIYIHWFTLLQMAAVTRAGQAEARSLKLNPDMGGKAQLLDLSPAASRGVHQHSAAIRSGGGTGPLATDSGCQCCKCHFNYHAGHLPK